jgi:hypothetical protein
LAGCFDKVTLTEFRSGSDIDRSTIKSSSRLFFSIVGCPIEIFGNC